MFFLKQTLLGSLVMSRVTSLSFGLALELVTGKWVVDRWLGRWEVSRGVSPEDMFANWKGQVEAQDAFQLFYRYWICGKPLVFPWESPPRVEIKWDAKSWNSKIYHTCSVLFNPSFFFCSKHKHFQVLETFALPGAYIFGNFGEPRRLTKPLPGLPWLSLLWNRQIHSAFQAIQAIYS